MTPRLTADEILGYIRAWKRRNELCMQLEGSSSAADLPGPAFYNPKAEELTVITYATEWWQGSNTPYRVSGGDLEAFAHVYRADPPAALACMDAEETAHMGRCRSTLKHLRSYGPQENAYGTIETLSDLLADLSGYGLRIATRTWLNEIGKPQTLVELSALSAPMLENTVTIPSREERA